MREQREGVCPGGDLLETLEGRTSIVGIFDNGGLYPVLKQGSAVTAQHVFCRTKCLSEEPGQEKMRPGLTTGTPGLWNEPLRSRNFSTPV